MAGTRKQKTVVRSKTSNECHNVSLTDNEVLGLIPSKLVSCLMPFQREGVLFAARKHGRCLIADEMGLGKTLQAIAVAYYFKSEWPLLIIVPSSLRYAWIEELEKWLPDVLPQEINLIQGGFDTGGIAEAKITIITYGLLSCKSSATVKEALQTRQFKVVICDESHYFKNPRTECCKAVGPLLTSSTRCILLSGTPALAKPSELFTQLDALLPGKFGSFWSFTAKYCAGHWEHFGRRRHWKADGASNLDELQQRLKSVMIRREKNSVLTQLPPKQRQKILFPLKDSKTKKEILSAFEELKPLLKSSKSSLAAGLLRGEQENGTGGPDGAHASRPADTSILSRIQNLYNLTGEAKIGPAREYVQMLCENGSLKFLVFAYHHAMMDGLQQTLWEKKVKFVRIDGQTKPSDRQLYVQRFQSDKTVRVAILSILAAGVGLTLTAASLVVFAELYWTPGVMVQCEDRAHRIGQTSTVPVHYLVARDTMDEWVWSAVCRKTLVTSTALTGKSRALKADAGDSYQVDLLSAADAYTPVTNADIDISQLLQSQLPQDQKSILDFFSSQPSSSQCSQASLVCPSDISLGHDVGGNQLDIRNNAFPTTSTPLNKVSKHTFSIFTSLKKSSKPSASQEPRLEPITLSSSEEEQCCLERRSPQTDKVTPKQKKVTSSKTRKEAQSSSGVSRKRKCLLMDSEDGSDCDFVDISSSFTHSEKKKKKHNSKSKPANSKPAKISSQKIVKTSSKVLKEPFLPTTKTNDRPEGNVTDSKQWSCSVCTFSNISLLPFCEMCETPRKQKNPSPQPNVSFPSASLETVGSPEILSQTEIQFTSPVCSSTQIWKQNTLEDDVALTDLATTYEEDHCESFSSVCQVKQTCEKDKQESSLNRHKIKRNLAFIGDDSKTDDTGYVNSKKSKSEGRVNKDLSTSLCEEDDDLYFSFQSEKVTQSDLVSTETTCTDIDDSEFVSFQLNSSLEKGSVNNSPRSSEAEQDEEGTAVVSDDDINQISSFSSEDSMQDTNTRSSMRTKTPISADIGSSKKDKSANLNTSLDMFGNEDLHSNSSVELVQESEAFETNDDETENITIPQLKPPKRKSFMLDTTKMAPLRNAVTLSDIDSLGQLIKGSKTSQIEDETDLTVCQNSEEKTVGENRLDDGAEERTQSEIDASNYTNKSTVSCTDEPEPCDQTHEAEHKNLSSQNSSRRSRGGEKDSGSFSEKAQCEKQPTATGDQPHCSFMFCCSTYTGRVHLFDKHGESLKANFLPLDVELNNFNDLPELLHHPQHLRLVQNFVRQWNSLTDTKRRLISKRGVKFSNPLAAYDMVRTDLTNNKQRYHTKGDQALVALEKAREVNGNVRVLSKHPISAHSSAGMDKKTDSNNTSSSNDMENWSKGYVQVVSADGTPLCVHCQQPCSSLVSKETLTHADTSWHSRFCSMICADAYWMKTNNSYLRSSIYDVQRGICQLCSLDAHTFFCQIRDSVNRKERAEKINKSKFSKMGADLKKQMIARPYEGLFWHVDHIRPVWEGGGQCDVDNLRTLCTPCHQSVTSKQATKRAHARKLSKAACAGDITAFFKKV